jgi:hypothetical protein
MMSVPPAGEVGGTLDLGFWGVYRSPASASFTLSACSSTTQTEALQAAYNSSQQELGVLQQATLEACQSIEEGVRQAGSSVASRLRALGGHVARRMRGVLRLVIQKALGMVQLHYRVDLSALATGYIITDDLYDDGVQDEEIRLDALAAPTADILADDFEKVLFPNAPPLGPSSPECSWALWQLGCN